MKRSIALAGLSLTTLFGIALHQESASARAAANPATAVALGTTASNRAALRDLRGNRRSLPDFTGHSAIVLAFLGTDCPISNLYLPGLIELEKKVRSQGVLFLAVYPNEHQDLDTIAIHTYERDLPFPVLKDVGQKLADSLGVTRVPTVAVLDSKFVLRYRGRIDDRYGVASRRPKATRADLEKALEEVLARKPVSVAETETDGCLIERASSHADASNVTYGKEVSRIIQTRCQECHRPNQTAPFALMNFEDASKHGRMIKEVVMERRMPPWHADARFGHFSNNRRLTQKEVTTLTEWVDAGMPRGSDSDLPPAVDWPQGWRQGKPDLVIQMPEEFQVPADGTLDYQRWEVPTGFTEDRWVQMAEAQPSAPSVVHHIVVYILRTGQRQPVAPDGTMSVLVAWAPGDMGLACQPDTALRVPKDSKLMFEMHYTPNGKPTKDRSKIGITFAKKPPKHELFVNFFANESIELPPFDPHYRAESTLRLRGDARIISFVPHMHWRGKDFMYEAIYPDGRRETLLSVPRWDFNWQNLYRLEEPIKLPKGSKIHAVAHWDNSRDNPMNPAPEKRVQFGLQTWDEMMVGLVAYVWERPETADELAKQPEDIANMIFDRMDRNGDDLITKDEVPARWRSMLLLSGVKVPDKMTREDFKVFFEDMRKKMQQARKRSGPNRPRGSDQQPDTKTPAEKGKP